MDERNYHDIEDWNKDCYETGSTKPPKSHGGLISVLLVAVILLGGISSALGVMNIRLFYQLNNRQEHFSPVSFSEINQTYHDPAATDAAVVAGLGISVSTVTQLEQRLYSLPAGVLVTRVAEGSPGAGADICVGDVILRADGQRLQLDSELYRLLEKKGAGQTLWLTIYRYRTHETIHVSITLAAQ